MSVSKHRAMDNMVESLHHPQGKTSSCVRGLPDKHLTIPNRPPSAMEYLDLERVAPRRAEIWKRTLFPVRSAVYFRRRKTVIPQIQHSFSNQRCCWRYSRKRSSASTSLWSIHPAPSISSWAYRARGFTATDVSTGWTTSRVDLRRPIPKSWTKAESRLTPRFTIALWLIGDPEDNTPAIPSTQDWATSRSVTCRVCGS